MPIVGHAHADPARPPFSSVHDGSMKLKSGRPSVRARRWNSEMGAKPLRSAREGMLAASNLGRW